MRENRRAEEEGPSEPDDPSSGVSARVRLAGRIRRAMSYECLECAISIVRDTLDASKCASGHRAGCCGFALLRCCNCAKSDARFLSQYYERACAQCKARASGGQRAASRQKEEELRQREEQLRQREEQLRHANAAAKPQQVQVLVPAAADLCPPHEFETRVLKNDATNRNGGLNASVAPVGIGAGVNAQSEHDHGERLVIYCKKCGKREGELGAPMQSTKGGCCVVT